MPKKTKDEEVKKVTKKETKKTSPIEVEEKSTSIKNTSKASKAKKSTTKATTSKPTAKKSSTSKKVTTTTKKATTKKTTAKSSTTQDKVGTKKTSTTQTSKKGTDRKSTSKKDATKKTTTKKTTSKSSSTKKVKTVVAPEYYDLPATYNRTIVKILAQTPSSLFVYWEISEDDRKSLQKQYGEEFFQNTRPYLIIINETMNYSFETEINDYANSWYIPIHDSSCKYSVQLIRKSTNHNISTLHSVINIISSNEIATPNDHILFDKLGKTVFFRDVKSNREIEKDISTLSFISNIGKVYNIYDLYKEIYKNELNGNELGMGLSSSGFSSTFK